MKKLIFNVAMMMVISLFAKGENGQLTKDSSLYKTQANSELAVEAIGQNNGYVFLKLLAIKGDNKAARLSISDGEGIELFTESFSIGQHSRVIMLSPEEISVIEIDFRSASGNLRKKYAIHMSRIATFNIEELSAQ